MKDWNLLGLVAPEGSDNDVWLPGREVTHFGKRYMWWRNKDTKQWGMFPYPDLEVRSKDA